MIKGTWIFTSTCQTYTGISNEAEIPKDNQLIHSAQKDDQIMLRESLWYKYHLE